ncbi:MAG: S8 family serine peptidase, partial [Deltaproteobacteria bacterium]|nr:S8 family serine peptidase [Deltaproteobacteria bacterium]
DVKPMYPAALGNANILTVASTTLDGKLEPYSNFGARSVHVAAPGGDVGAGLWGPDFLGAAGAGYVRLTGTSMATPVTAGVAALVKSAYPEAGAVELKSLVMSTGVPSPALSGVTATASVVNASLAVNAAQRAALMAALRKGFGTGPVAQR